MITIELTQAEVSALAGLLDVGVRATGLRAVKEAAGLLEKIERAVEEAGKCPAPPHGSKQEKLNASEVAGSSAVA